MNQLEICNAALALAGLPAIVSLNDTNNNAVNCKTFFPSLRNRVLRDHVWSFATKFSVLSKLAEVCPDDDYTFVYALPLDCVLLIELQPRADFRKVARKIYTSADNVKLIYIAKVEDCELYDDLFIDALTNLLASKLVALNSRDGQLINFFDNEYVKMITLAKGVDSQENAVSLKPYPRKSSFLEARGGGD